MARAYTVQRSVRQDLACSGRYRTFREANADAVDAFERGYLEELMRRHTSLHAASDASGMDRKHLRTLLRRHGLRDN